MNDTYTIQFTDENSHKVILPAITEHKGEVKEVAFGTLLTYCEVEYNADLEKTIIISKKIANELKIRESIKIHVMIHDGVAHLGPLIGIFTAGFTPSILRPIGERSLFFSKFLSIEQSLGLCTFVFGAHHINWDEGTINGFIYDQTGWRQTIFPFPNVVYDRLPNRRIENHKLLKEVKSKLTELYSIPWYNPGFFNKWEMHQLLKDDSSISSYLPETYINPTITQMEEMLTKYRSIFLKPTNGSLGLGVFHLMYSKEENEYFSRYRDDNNINRLRKFPSLEHFLKYAFQDRKLSDYLAQQGIKLIRLNQSQIDFRIHTNKNENGNWEITALAAKVAGKGSVTTHLNNGGIVKTLDEIYENEDEKKQVLQLLTDVSIRLSDAIDRRIEGFIGEIGFDLGIDQDGQIWMFEANSKPGRSIFSHPGLKRSDLLSRKLSLLYGQFLAEKAIKEPGILYK